MIEVVEANFSLPEHSRAIVRLMNEYALDAMGGGRELPDAVKENLAAELEKRQDAVVILAFVDGQAAGLINCFEGFSTFLCKPLLNIHDVVVTATCRGEGLSKRMLQKVEKIAVDRGCCKLTLEVLEGNTIAQAAYRSAGFLGYELDPKLGRAMFWEKKLN